jgi:hypothetical protein
MLTYPEKVSVYAYICENENLGYEVISEEANDG